MFDEGEGGESFADALFDGFFEGDGVVQGEGGRGEEGGGGVEERGVLGFDRVGVHVAQPA